MAYTGRFGQSDDFRREELIRKIEHSVENLTLQELEALYNNLTKIYTDCLSIFNKTSCISINYPNHIIYRFDKTMMIQVVLDSSVSF